MKPLVIIPARGGSKGIPGKNSKILHGKPLIQYTIECALEVFTKEQIVVSTDDEKIQNIAKNCGLDVPNLRPEHLATDTASSYDVILNCIEENKSRFDFDTIVLLQPTSPLRKPEHISEALSHYSIDLDMVVSVNESGSNPYYSLFEENSEGYLNKSKEGNFTRRQDCPIVYEYNGSIYVMNRTSLEAMSIGEFTRIKKYVMDKKYALDLDTPLDWKIAEILMLESET